MEFEYPIISNDNLPTSNPYGIISSILPWNWINKDWDTPIEQNIDYIKKKFPDSYLPIGTKLYNGSLHKDLDFKSLKKDRITFFGLDIIISLWYILEMQPSYTNFIQGRIYEFTVIKPIPFYLLSKLYDNPKDNSDCNEKDIACIHPQIAFHGDTAADPPYDLSIELTMNMKYFKDFIQIKHTYLVDPRILYNNTTKLFKQFNPVDSITGIELSNIKFKGKRRSYKKNKLIRKSKQRSSRKNKKV